MNVSLDERRFTKDNEARRRSRQVIGKVPGVRIILDKRRKKEKHKKDLTNQEALARM